MILKSTLCVPLPFVCFVVLGTSILSGCGLQELTKDADEVIDRHFQAVASSDLESAMADYDTSFFEKTSKDEWSKVLSKVVENLGSFQSHKVSGWRAMKNAGNVNNGTTVSFQCKVSYSKHTAIETFTLFRGSREREFKITGHQINSPILLNDSETTR